MYYEFQTILLHTARVRFIDDGARKSDLGDCDDNNLQCVFISFYSSGGWILDRGMGNQLVVRQVVIRSFNSYKGKWYALSFQIPRIAAMPNARKHQREPKAQRLLGDRGPRLRSIV